MGKARKDSRAKSSGFAPDYMQADDFVCSGRIDSQMKHLEESPPLKRSCFGLNGGSRSVPKEVLSLSKISRSERENLFHKLKMELQQVRDLSKRIACLGSDTVSLSSYNDIQSCSDGPRRPPPENFVGSQGKKRPPVRSDKQRAKKGPSRLHVPTSSTSASVMKECETLLNRLWSHKFGWPFRTPVDPVMLNIPDYFTVIKHPMDLGTIRSRLRNGEYSSPMDFAADARLTFSNSMAYNPPGNQFHNMAQGLSKYFESGWKSIEKKIPVAKPPVIPLTSSASLESDIPFEVAPLRKKAAAVNESKPRVEPAKLVMTDDEKKKLSQDLVALDEDFPQNIVDLLREQSGNDGQSGEVEIEIDIETLSDEILFKVRKLLDDFLREKKKSQEKGEPCEMEIVHDSGFSNSPLQPSKGDPQIDEDVDIVGGNDPSVSSHHPLKIEKNAACRNNESSSSSSSSSESGSSSSDSDSCSSSGSETDSIKASNPTSREDKKEPGVGINRKDDDNNNEKIVNDSLNELGRLEHVVGEKSTSMDAIDVFPDEETAPPERQISPEKRYRAALLKNRFADTIMKAREKALTKGEKGDPEKLRREREEFEKRLREEKLRLEAEAKAAEEDRRKAKAEAAEKLRRETEQKREASRQALQKMEKTVEINEGRRFMEDLEMLRATSAEGDQLSTFMEEMSPKLSPDMLGSFKMEGNNNPLEQLGLFMKMDDDEDEEEDDQPQFSQGEVEKEHPHDRIEAQRLSPFKEDGDEHLVSGNEEPVSQKTQDNGNQEDENPISQNKREEPVENMAEQESRVVDMEEDVDMGGQEHEVVDEGMQVTEDVEKGEEETKAVDMMIQQETEVVDMGEEEAEVVDKGEEEAEAVDMMREQETEVVDMGEEEADVVDMMRQEETEVDKGEEETEAVDMMREQETEVVDMGEEEADVVDMMREQETEVDMGEEEADVVDMMRQEETEVDKGEEETEAAEKENEEIGIVDKRDEGIEVVDKEEGETEVVDKGILETEVVDMGVQGSEVVDKGEEEGSEDTDVEIDS